MPESFVENDPTTHSGLAETRGIVDKSGQMSIIPEGGQRGLTGYASRYCSKSPPSSVKPATAAWESCLAQKMRRQLSLLRW